MFALFTGNTDEDVHVGIETLHALRSTLTEATDHLTTLVESDSGIDWGHVANLDLPGLPIVARWDPRGWEILSAPEHIENLADNSDDEDEDEDDEREESFLDLAGLGAMDPETTNVSVMAEHRQSWDGPAVFGPFDTAAEARDFVLDQYRTGEFDSDGCAVEYRENSR